jgi:hypothetical protein
MSMNNSQQQTGQGIQPLPHYDSKEELSEADKSIVARFTDMRGKQLDFLDETGKSLIERIATFLAVLFAVTTFSNTFPPPYLKGNTPAKVFIIITLVLFVASLLSAISVIRPIPYSYNEQNISSMRDALQRMTQHKSRWLRVANWLFVGGAIALSILIVVVVWGV